MADVYEEAIQRSDGKDLTVLRQQVANVDGDMQFAADTRTMQNEVNHLFPLLPNPELVMYVFPHLVTSEQLPVPGYTTAFSLYEKNYYAMPGETAQTDCEITSC